MKTKNPMQLKALVKNKAAENQISAQLVMQNYMLERLLERITLSSYQSNFILKGGFLIAAIVGLDTRATMDLDTTVKGITLTHEKLEEIFREICQIQVDDDVTMEVMGLTDIRAQDDYPGIRVSLMANYPPLRVPLSVDVTTGDKITPKEIEYTFRLIFDDRAITIWAYNLETVLAEKLETVLTRAMANTRPRDFYDIYVIYKMRGHLCDFALLREALEQTATKRKSTRILTQTEATATMDQIRSSERLQSFWTGYQKDFHYAAEISFADTCACIDEILRKIGI